MNIWCFNHYAITPGFAGGARHFELCRALGEAGHHSVIFAANFIHMNFRFLPLPENKKSNVEEFGPLKFVWLRTSEYKKNNWRRLINMLSYCLRAWRESGKLVKSGKIAPPDVVWGSTVHPFAAVTAAFIARRFCVPFVFEIRDLWPQTFIDMGIWSEKSLPSRFFRWLEKAAVRKSNGVIVLAEATAQYLEQRYAYLSRRIARIPNGANIAAFAEAKPETTRRQGLNLVYLGGVDLVHNLGQLLEAQKILDAEGFPCSLRIYGDGKQREFLENQYRNVSSIYWEGSVEKKRVPRILAGADVLCMSTADVRYGSENKLFEYLAAGKPIIAAVSAESNQLAGKIGAGFDTPPNSPVLFAEAVKRMAALTSGQREEMGMKGRAYVLAHHDWRLLSSRLVSLLTEILDETRH